MPIPWTTVISAIPWGDVARAAPDIVKRARRLLARSEPPPQEETPASAAPPDVAALQVRVAELAEEQRLSAELIKSLAEHNDRIVQAIEVIRLRTRMLLALCVLQWLALGGLAVWIALR